VQAAVRDEPLTGATHGAERLGQSLRGHLGRGAPEVPSSRAVSATGRAVVRASIVAQHRKLVAMGMPRGFLVGRLDGERRERGRARPARRGRRERADEREAAAKVKPDLGIPGQRANGIDLLVAGPGERVLKGWAEEGVDLISTLARKATADLPRLIVEAAAKGRRWEQLVEVAREMGAKTLSHARLIARDQVAKINGRVTQEMQTAAGLTMFRWRTSGDERVRESHLEAEHSDIGHGEGVYLWSEGAPNTGFYGTSSLPGQAGNCRCRAEPVLEPGTRAAWAAAA
jgi:hypothetical protein